MGIIEAIKKIEREDAFEKGIEKGKTEVVANLISTGNFSISQIANFANVPESFVRKFKEGTKKINSFHLLM